MRILALSVEPDEHPDGCIQYAGFMPFLSSIFLDITVFFLLGTAWMAFSERFGLRELGWQVPRPSGCEQRSAAPSSGTER